MKQYLINRRLKLAQTHSQSAFLILAGRQETRTPHSFRAWSDFIYYSGMNIQGARLLICGEQSFLFVEAVDEKTQLWDGLPYDENEVAACGFSQIYFHEDFAGILAGLSYEKLFSNVPVTGIETQNFPFSARQIRLIKEEIEMASLRQAAHISAQVHREVNQQLQAGVSEKEISLWMDSRFRALGSERNAYQSIVASRERACTLHGLASGRKLGPQELVLIDAACEFDFYASDLTRTYVVGRTLSREQEKIYDLVLLAQKTALARVRPGETLNSIHQAAGLVLREGLAQLGLPADSATFQVLYPHGTSHWIGLDVHDVGRDAHDTLLEENMCFTVEPGLYFHPRLEIPAYSGLGIRIEDDVRVTADGCEILTHFAPKEKSELFS